MRSNGKDDDGYIDGERYYETGIVGAAIHVKVFALTACADDRLAGLVFSTGTIDNPNTNTEGTPAPAPQQQGGQQPDNDKKNAKEDVSNAMTDVDSNAKHADEAQKEIEAAKNAARDKCKAPACTSKFHTLDFDFDTGKSDAGKLAEYVKKLQGVDPEASERFSKASSDYSLAVQRTDDALIALQKKLGDIAKRDKDTGKKIQSSIDQAREDAKKGNFAAVKTQLDKVETAIDKTPSPPGTTPPAPPKWKPVTVAGQQVSVQDYTAPVPAGDGHAFFTVTTKNLVTDPKDANKTKPVWPDTTLSVKVKHGDYFWEAGYTFSAVYHGTRTKNGMTTACKELGKDGPDACKWASQSLLAGTLFFGRPKFATYDRRNWIPGIQIGLNADLTKITDAIALGLVLEPITGLALSGGVIYYSRAATAVPSTDGTQPRENVFLPYVGVTLNSGFIDTIKSLGGSGDKAGNASADKVTAKTGDKGGDAKH